eukprot:m.119521 g.119521  ORF g.119521 m.119521 type:complete len:57 (+) comp15596_c0_seq2:1684-1854(+)
MRLSGRLTPNKATYKAMQSSVSTTGFATGTKGKFEENGTLHSVAKWSCWSCNGTDM